MQRVHVGLIHILTLFAVAGCCFGFAGVAFALPSGRHYEMVSPVSKGGFGAQLSSGLARGAVSANGESIAFYSAGIFDGAPSFDFHANYLARRGTNEWETVPLAVPSSVTVDPETDLSPDLSLELAVGPPNTHEYELREEVAVWLRPTLLLDTPESWQGPTSTARSEGHNIDLSYETASADLCHMFMVKNESAIDSNKVEPIAEAEGTTQQLYQIDRGCHGEQSGIQLVGVNNNDKMISKECLVNIGNDYGRANGYNAVSADGSEVFFTDCPVEPTVALEAPHHQLFVRVGGKRTLEVSRPLEAAAFGGCVGETGGVPGEVPCKGATERAAADFQGASETGSKVYFTAPLEKGQGQLVSGDTDESTNLYIAEIGCPQANPGCAASEREVTSLTEASHDPSGGAAQVQGVLRVASDGQRAYFVASGDLLSAEQRQTLEMKGRPVPQTGAANLYEYDSAANSVSFVADLCTGSEKSGIAEDVHCPAGSSDEGLWTGSEDESQTGGPGGEYFVFSTYAQLTSGDVNTAKDVYRYDALTGTLLLVSHGENDYEPNASGAMLGSHIAPGGSKGGSVVEQHQLDVRAISEDGSRVVFTSAEPLSPADTNGLVNAYEWHEGAVSLVSTGSDPEGVGNAVISADGSSLVFATSERLVTQDADELSDVYVARLNNPGKEFPQPPAQRKPCEGDGCQGPLTNPAPLLVPGSVSQVPGENAAPPVKAKPKAKAKPKCKRGQVRDKHGRCVKHKRRGGGARANRSRSSSNRGGRS
jgi:hypothetical protein